MVEFHGFYVAVAKYTNSMDSMGFPLSIQSFLACQPTLERTAARPLPMVLHLLYESRVEGMTYRYTQSTEFPGSL